MRGLDYVSEGIEMDWVFRIFTMVAAIGFSALVSGGASIMILGVLEGINTLRFPIAAIPICIGIYASWHISISCLMDDLGKQD